METVTLALTKADAYLACQAIASHRVWTHCECEPETGYTCAFCKRHFDFDRKMPDLEAVARRYGEMLFAKLMRQPQSGT